MATVQLAEKAPASADSVNTSRRIAGATGIMMAAILASRLLGLVRNAVISYQFGQGFETDVYYGAFMIPDMLFFLIAGGALSSAFIPVFTEKITTGREEEAWHVFSTVACIMLVIVTGFVIAGEIFTAPLVKLMNFGFTPEKVAKTVPLTRIVLPAQVCFFLGGLMMGSQYARNKFLIPALGPCIYNLGIIFGGVVLAKWLGVQGLCWGALVGAIVGNFLLQLWAVARSGMKFRVSFNGRHPDVMKVWKLMLPVVLGLALPQVSILFNRMFASRLGDGPQSALTNANQLMQVPLGLFAQAMAVAIFPAMSALAAQKKYGELRSTASSGIRALLFLTIPSSVFMIVMATPVIQLLLQQGRFHAVDTPATATALIYYAIGIFAWSAQSILARGFYAMQDSVTPVVVGTLVTFVFIPMNWLFMETFHMGFAGLALATTVAAAMHMFVMLYILRNRLHGFEGRKMAVSICKVVVASAVAGMACWAALRGMNAVFAGHHGGVKLRALTTLVAGFGIGTAVYLVCARALHIEEMKQAIAMLRRKRRPAATS